MDSVGSVVYRLNYVLRWPIGDREQNIMLSAFPTGLVVVFGAG